jgi:MFS family permease
MDEPPLVALYVLAALVSSFAAIDGPTRTAVIPMLVAPEHMRSAVQLREVLTQSGRVLGPMIAGLLLIVGIGEAYAVDALSFAIAFVLFLGLPPLVPEVRRRFELSSITESLAFVGKRPILAASFWADIIAMVFGQQRALYPAYAATVFHVGKFELGLMGAAPAAGAVIGLGFVGLTRHVRHEGAAVLVSVAAWGACIALFAISPWFWMALLFLALAGAADMVSALFRQTILWAIVPDELRGRMGAVHIMVVTGGPPVGDALSGATAEVLGVRPASLVGGLAVIGGVLVLAARVPSFARWRAPAAPPPANQPA